MSGYERRAVTTNLGRVHVGAMSSNNLRGVTLETDDGGRVFIPRDSVQDNLPVRDGTEFPFRG